MLDVPALQPQGARSYLCVKHKAAFISNPTTKITQMNRTYFSWNLKVFFFSQLSHLFLWNSSKEWPKQILHAILVHSLSYYFEGTLWPSGTDTYSKQPTYCVPEWSPTSGLSAGCLVAGTACPTVEFSHTMYLRKT